MFVSIFSQLKAQKTAEAIIRSTVETEECPIEGLPTEKNSTESTIEPQTISEPALI